MNIDRRVINRALQCNYIALPIPLWCPFVPQGWTKASLAPMELLASTYFSMKLCGPAPRGSRPMQHLQDLPASSRHQYLPARPNLPAIYLAARCCPPASPPA